MPIIERDPWREQYFEGVECPDDVVIPTDDEHAYALYPEQRWIYNKLLVCDSQGIAAAPHGVPPPSFPVFSKPIYNMHGMGVGGMVVHDEEEHARHINAGHMWMELMQGEHVSIDAVLVGGEAQWWRHTVGQSVGNGVFDYWTVQAEERPELERYCGDWLRRNLRGYSGAVNIETIGGRIIEAHLRFADQWPDLYGEGWLAAIVGNLGRNRARRAAAPDAGLDELPEMPGVDESAHPEAVVEQRESARRWNERLAALPARYRRAVELRHISGLSYPELAIALERPLGTVKSDVHRGVRLLREAMALNPWIPERGLLVKPEGEEL